MASTGNPTKKQARKAPQPDFPPPLTRGISCKTRKIFYRGERRGRKEGKDRFNLEKAVGRTFIAQALDSLGYMKKMLITNKVTTHFFITPFKSTSYTLHALPTAFSRFNPFWFRLRRAEFIFCTGFRKAPGCCRSRDTCAIGVVRCSSLNQW